jgi:hypothetical protein
VLHRQPALLPRFGEFVVEVLQLEVLPVVLVVSGVLVAGGDEHYPVRAAVVERPEAHRARLSEHVDVVPLEVLAPEPLARLPYGHYLGMGGRIVGLHHEVRALGDDLAVARDHAREGPSAIFNVLQSQLDSALDRLHALFPLW